MLRVFPIKSPLKISGRPLGLIILLMGLMGPLLAAACGGGGPTAVPQAAVPAAVSPGIKVELSSQGPLDRHLVDAGGMTLYLFTNDQTNVSSCSGGCANTWPPLLTDGDPVAGEGLDAGQLATMQRQDGSNQVTYNGRPLYHFANDQRPGDTLGQDRGGVWYVVSPDGNPVLNTAEVSTPGPADY